MFGVQDKFQSEIVGPLAVSENLPLQILSRSTSQHSHPSNYTLSMCFFPSLDMVGLWFPIVFADIFLFVPIQFCSYPYVVILYLCSLCIHVYYFACWKLDHLIFWTVLNIRDNMPSLNVFYRIIFRAPTIFMFPASTRQNFIPTTRSLHQNPTSISPRKGRKKYPWGGTKRKEEDESDVSYLVTLPIRFSCSFTVGDWAPYY